MTADEQIDCYDISFNEASPYPGIKIIANDGGEQ